MLRPELWDAEVAAAAENLATKAVEEERALLGCFFYDPDLAREFGPRLKESDMTDAAYRFVLRAMHRLIRRNEEIGHISVQNLFKTNTEAMEAANRKPGGLDFIVDLAYSIPTAAAAPYYFRKVKDAARRRQLSQLAHIIKADAFDLDNPDPIASTLQKVMALDQGEDKSTVRRLADVLRSQYDRIEKAYETVQAGGRPRIATTGFYDIDQMLVMTGGKLIIGAARPAMGKTSWSWQFGCNVALTDPTYFATLEMPGEALGARVFSAETGITSNQQAHGAVRDEGWSALSATIDRYENLDLYIDDAPSSSISQIFSATRRLQARLGKPLGAVIIDYLGLLDGEGKDEQAKTAAIARAAKQMAMALDVPVYLLSQLSRAVESRTDKRPQLSDLRSSGAIEQDADIVMFFYRDEYYSPDSKERGIAEVIVAKHRDGPVGTVKLYFDAAATKFSNITEPLGYNLPAIDDGSSWIAPPPAQEYDDV